MDFTFNEDQLLFQEGVRDFLTNEVTPEKIRELWETDSGRSPALWGQLTELGLTGLTVPEAFGGMGMNELDFVLLAQECGYVALPEPLVQTVLVAVPTLVNSSNEDLKAKWLPQVAEGAATIAVGLEQNLLVEDAHIADLLLMEKNGNLYAVEQADVTLEYNQSVDPSRKLYQVSFDESRAMVVAEGDEAQALVNGALNRGALGCAAQALGLTQRMIDISVQYTSERTQFGVAIGTFQAVKHRMANVAVPLEYAKATVAQAAYAIANNVSSVDKNVSHAKSMACAASLLGAKNSIQVHGAMGYTWEVNLHIYMKRAWALDKTWGDQAFHKGRVAEAIFADDALLGAGNTFVR
ncbi:alkylation response protein AidB-like acyl-CoA dehydrogenase [Sinobacterium caligoides]|uniref:Alkylation response protein AidB-like acyl-CoA dehydrogenase n=1 Tax=Sinobacterium caligoides TaxID=933926 RepID=A0A3N2E0H9_9GAMM|nr:acyl-CoA dehydrogenase family protein [Sinobacterium caligoides]ROS05613.1 alkylation response protein AidB-like acyl-CoA dehydrogenase [Sinobacterium caligoides]